jgi:hypothetical protein
VDAPVYTNRPGDFHVLGSHVPGFHVPGFHVPGFHVPDSHDQVTVTNNQACMPGLRFGS